MGERSRDLTVRFYAEANARDGAPFSTSIKVGNPPRDAFLEKVPAVNERQIQTIYPFRAPDGTWGCSLKLDNDGRIALEVVSTERRGTLLVGFVGTAKGQHRLQDILIDRTVTDGVLTIGHGLTDLEIAMLGKQFKIVGGAEIPKAPKLKSEPRSWWPFGKKKQPAA
jgi:hypothetical protein